MFFNRTSSMLMKMFEYMLRTHTEEAACVTHGGVIMNMLSQHALPFRKPEEWMTDPGAGYSVRLDAEMWMRDHLAEAYDVVPHGVSGRDGSNLRGITEVLFLLCKEGTEEILNNGDIKRHLLGLSRWLLGIGR